MMAAPIRVEKETVMLVGVFFRAILYLRNKWPQQVAKSGVALLLHSAPSSGRRIGVVDSLWGTNGPWFKCVRREELRCV